MRVAGFLVLAAASFFAFGNEQEIQKALIQRDQQSAEFAAGVNGRDAQRFREFHELQRRDAGRPLHADPEIARQLRPYERERAARETEGFVLQLPPPKPNGLTSAGKGPLPLPGGPRHGVEPVARDGVGG